MGLAAVIGSAPSYRSFFLAGLIVLSLITHAQDWEVYDMDNSPIPSTTVNSLLDDGSGGVWVGTDWGLCHFDGDGLWEVFQTGNSDMPENFIRALAMDAGGSIWVGFQSAGMAKWDGATWTVFNTSNSFIAENEVRDLFVDHRNWVWITTSSGLSVFTGSEWFLYDATDESHDGLILASSSTNCVAVRTDGLVCLGTVNGGLHFLEEDEVFYLNIPNDGFFDNTATDVLFDPVTGDRWVATPSAGVLRQQGPAFGGSWFQWALNIGFPADGISALSMDDLSQVWVATHAAGIVQMGTDGNWVQFDTGNSGLPDNETRSIAAGADGVVWIGTTYGGLARYQASVGAPELDLDMPIRVFPNPTTDFVTVVLDQRVQRFDWSILTMDGRTVKAGVVAGFSAQLELLDLARAPYMIKIGTESSTDLIKVIVR
jgi:ligand-binding sensor domain-containing protein